MRMPTALRLWLTAVCLALLPSTVLAQGVLTGQIGDATWLGLPAVVDAVGVSTFDAGDRVRAAPLTVTADADGWYRLDLPAGVYSVRFSLPGYGTVIREDIRLEDECRVSLDVRLWPVTLREGVTVSGVHPYAASRSMADRLLSGRRGTGATSADPLWRTPLVERSPRTSDWRHDIDRQLFWKQVEDACLGYVPMWLSHPGVVRASRPCSVS